MEVKNMAKNKVVIPGEQIGYLEEGEAGENAYLDKEEIYAETVGVRKSQSGKVGVSKQEEGVRKIREVKTPELGGTVYCMVAKTSLNNAICDCMIIEKGDKSDIFGSVLPVTAIRSEYVEDLRNEIKVGDIIKAKINKKTKTGFEISISEEGFGVVKAFCPKCREPMHLKSDLFICNCGWKERKKLTTTISSGYQRRGNFNERKDFKKRERRY